MIETWNKDCYCVSLDRPALRRAIESDPATQGLHALIAERCPHVFSALPVFVSRAHVDRMAEVVRAAESVIALPSYQEAALRHAPAIARHDPRTRSVFMGYDFHLGPGGPRLIEINTNAGGAMLNAVLGRAQRDCCEDVSMLESGALPPAKLERAFVEMFRDEWRLAGRRGPLARLAIVDEDPQQQYLYPEFLLFAGMFARFGIEAEVLAPSQLTFSEGALRDAKGPVDLVYNRLTDFALEAPSNAHLREAYLADAAVLTPHPRAHALHADKRNLALLTDGALLRSWGVPEAAIGVLLRGIAKTVVVDPADAEALWAARRGLFFKPAAGYGSKAAYRGEKITKRVWAGILSGRYVAQELVVPGERRVGPDEAMKVDVRNYAYGGEVQLLAARLYQGQTTNFRTERGGFAPVLTASAHNLLERGRYQRTDDDRARRDQGRDLPDAAAPSP